MAQAHAVCASSDSMPPPSTWHLHNLLRLHKTVLEIHAACCALQPLLRPLDWQLPSAASAEPCTLLQLAQQIFKHGGSQAGKLLRSLATNGPSFLSTLMGLKTWVPSTSSSHACSSQFKVLGQFTSVEQWSACEFGKTAKLHSSGILKETAILLGR